MFKQSVFFIIIVLFISASAFAKDEYIYRQRVNWVKLEQGNSSIVALSSIKHPDRNITADQMEAMLLTIKISKKYVIKKDVESADVFNSWEARKFAAYFVEALAKASADQVVNFAIIHKRPTFIIQNDRLTMGYLWAADDGVHLYFTKLFAKIDGDYQASAHIDKAIRRAKSLNITLEANAGQKLSYNSPLEIIMDPNYDFMTQTANDRLAAKQAEDEEMRGSSRNNLPPPVNEEGKAQKSAPVGRPTTTSTNAADRLKQLDQLKAQKLITEAEYQKLRQKILSEL
ncbi:MAG: hypothetical protein ACD_73C00321G0005 [uncultured bacterium]|nr:MAG: hypothetical protein ACD_73C00321G0005 [uncultured bacterium]